MLQLLQSNKFIEFIQQEKLKTNISPESDQPEKADSKFVKMLNQNEQMYIRKMSSKIGLLIDELKGPLNESNQSFESARSFDDSGSSFHLDYSNDSRDGR